MSGKLMGEVYNLDLPRGEQSVLLAMAENANDEGGDCFPGLPYLQWKTRYSERQIQRLIRSLEQRGIVTLLTSRSGGRGNVACYQIDITKGDKKSPFIKNGYKKKGDISDGKGDICDTAQELQNKVLNITEPPIEPSLEPPIGDPAEKPKKKKASKKKVAATPEESEQIRECFDYWRVEHRKPTAKLSEDSPRWKSTLGRIRDGFTVEQIKSAIRGIKFSAFHMGKNDRGEFYADLFNVCKTIENVERFIELDERGQNAKSGFPQGNGGSRTNGAQNKPAPNGFKAPKPGVATEQPELLEVPGSGLANVGGRSQAVPLLAAQDYAAGFGDHSSEVRQAEVIPITSAARFTPSTGPGYRFG